MQTNENLLSVRAVNCLTAGLIIVSAWPLGSRYNSGFCGENGVEIGNSVLLDFRSRLMRREEWYTAWEISTWAPTPCVPFLTRPSNAGESSKSWKAIGRPRDRDTTQRPEV